MICDASRLAHMISRRHFFKSLVDWARSASRPRPTDSSNPRCSFGYALQPFAAAMALRSQAQDRGHRRPARLRSLDVARPHQGIVERTNALKPDIIVMLGDYVAGIAM
jgi:hypothetical protein